MIKLLRINENLDLHLQLKILRTYCYKKTGDDQAKRGHPGSFKKNSLMIVKKF